MVPVCGFLLDVLWQTGSLSFAQSAALKQRMEPFKGRRSVWSLPSCNDYTQELWLRSRLKVCECKLQGMERANWIDLELVSPLQSWVCPQYYSQDVAFDLGLRPFSRWTLLFPISVTTSLHLCLVVFVGFCFPVRSSVHSSGVLSRWPSKLRRWLLLHLPDTWLLIVHYTSVHLYCCSDYDTARVLNLFVCQHPNVLPAVLPYYQNHCNYRQHCAQRKPAGI